MKIAQFDPQGGPVTAEVTLSNGKEGSYTLYLWESASNTIVQKWRGNFQNAADDAYELPKPLAKLDGRLVEALVTVARGPAKAKLTITQGGEVLQTAELAVPKGAIGVSPDLFIQLEAVS